MAGGDDIEMKVIDVEDDVKTSAEKEEEPQDSNPQKEKELVQREKSVSMEVSPPNIEPKADTEPVPEVAPVDDGADVVQELPRPPAPAPEEDARAEAEEIENKDALSNLVDLRFGPSPELSPEALAYFADCEKFDFFRSTKQVNNYVIITSKQWFSQSKKFVWAAYPRGRGVFVVEMPLEPQDLHLQEHGEQEMKLHHLYKLVSFNAVWKQDNKKYPRSNIRLVARKDSKVEKVPPRLQVPVMFNPVALDGIKHKQNQKSIDIKGPVVNVNMSKNGQNENCDHLYLNEKGTVRLALCKDAPNYDEQSVKDLKGKTIRVLRARIRDQKKKYFLLETELENIIEID